MNNKGYISSEDYLKIGIFAIIMVIAIKFFILPNITINIPVNETVVGAVQDLQNKYDTCIDNKNTIQSSLDNCNNLGYLYDLEEENKTLKFQFNLLLVFGLLACLVLFLIIIYYRIKINQLNLQLKSKRKKC